MLADTPQPCRPGLCRRQSARDNADRKVADKLGRFTRPLAMNKMPKQLGWISALLAAARLTAGLLPVAARGQGSRRALPNVVTIEVPVYPWAVKEAHIEGIVHIKVTTDGRAVTTAEIQDGPRLLAIAAENNVRSWRFSPHDPITFIVTYEYKIAKTPGLSPGRSADNNSVILRLPTYVGVTTVPPTNVDLSPKH
jgi:hypothetical protein